MNYLIISEAAGYLPRRLVEPYIKAERLHLAKDAPIFHSPVYVVRRSVANLLERRAHWSFCAISQRKQSRVNFHRHSGAKANDRIAEFAE